MKNTVSSVGEFNLVNLIKNNFVAPVKNLENSNQIGDDCFCFKFGKQSICITKDLLIENTHFKTSWTNPFLLGKKSIEVNISDLAAMGNIEPKFIFIGLGIPPKTSLSFVKDLYKGFGFVCKKYNTFIAGGDTVKADKIIISVTAVGVCKDKIIKRSGAKNRDLIGVTNFFGLSAAGVFLLHKYHGKKTFDSHEKFLISKQNEPKAKLKEAQKISKYINSLTDSSDGLSTSVKLICGDSKKGADIFVEKIPVAKSLKKVFPDFKKQIEFTLFGGEDYGLVFTVPPQNVRIIKTLVPSISFIGKINLSEKIRYFHNGKEKKIESSEFKHF